MTTTTEESASAVEEGGTEEVKKDDTNGGGNGKKEYVADCPEPAFHLGCYMALGEEIHRMAHGSDTMQSSVAGICETPRKLLPGVIIKIRNAQIKMNRVDDELANHKFRIALESSFYTFSSAWKEGCPPHLSDEEQFQFWRGYSYQKYMVLQWRKKQNEKGSK